MWLGGVCTDDANDDTNNDANNDDDAQSMIV